MKKLSLELFSFKVDKDDSMNLFLECQNQRNMSYWNLMFYRHFSDWELELVDSILEPPYANTPRRDGFDRMRWQLNTLIIHQSMIAYPSSSNSNTIYQIYPINSSIALTTPKHTPSHQTNIHKNFIATP